MQNDVTPNSQTDYWHQRHNQKTQSASKFEGFFAKIVNSWKLLRVRLETTVKLMDGICRTNLTILEAHHFLEPNFLVVSGVPELTWKIYYHYASPWIKSNRKMVTES